MDAEQALQQARTYREQGKYQEALEAHEYYHLNILKQRPSHYGVRLSFALSDWMRLAEKYPKARKRLLEIRDEDVRKIESGQWEFQTFHDVVAISKMLNEDQVAVQCFKVIDGQETDQQKLQKCFGVVLEHLVSHHETALSNKYLTDAEAMAQKHVKEFKELEAFIINHPTPEKTSTAKNIFISRMTVLVRALQSANRTKDVENVYRAGQGIIPDEEYKAIFELDS